MKRKRYIFIRREIEANWLEDFSSLCLFYGTKRKNGIVKKAKLTTI